MAKKAGKKEVKVKEKKEEAKEAKKRGKEKEMRDIGIPTKNLPADSCEDENCPFHGHLKIRGNIFQCEVVSIKSKSNAVVEWHFTRKLEKYERLQKRKSRIVAHAPTCLHVKEGDNVVIAECRPISKTKKFVVIERLV